MLKTAFPVLALLALPGVAGAQTPLYADMTDTNLPPGVLDGPSMAARAADVDGDGDLDILVASEFRPNILLLNDGSGRFADASDRLPRGAHDSEDIGVADFDGDGDLDLVFVSEDDEIHELYLNDGAGRFTDASDRIPVRSIANGVAVDDLNGDGRSDLILANRGQDIALINTGDGFVDETASRLPSDDDTTQDLALGDVDGDGDNDLVFAVEGPDRLLRNDGAGVFTPAEAFGPADESRTITLADVDGDGDLDAYFSNVGFTMRGPLTDRLWINDGSGGFTDETAARLPPEEANDFFGGLLDLDSDGHPDILYAPTTSLGGPGNGAFRALLNDGSGHFTDATAEILPPTAQGNAFDAVLADFNGDGKSDLYLALRFGGDRLLLRQ